VDLKYKNSDMAIATCLISHSVVSQLQMLEVRTATACTGHHYNSKRHARRRKLHC